MHRTACNTPCFISRLILRTGLLLANWHSHWQQAYWPIMAASFDCMVGHRQPEIPKTTGLLTSSSCTSASDCERQLLKVALDWTVIQRRKHWWRADVTCRPSCLITVSAGVSTERWTDIIIITLTTVTVRWPRLDTSQVLMTRWLHFYNSAHQTSLVLQRTPWLHGHLSLMSQSTVTRSTWWRLQCSRPTVQRELTWQWMLINPAITRPWRGCAHTTYSPVLL